ncbi:flavodoxin domain-containing protein [Streptomyces sp. NPDC050085]|uniref:flavodoxin domain-containing protein n=1 Tax=Streptomyces sp. NPDC050085 TaxID=3365600 RepID=UPI003788F663
MSVLIGCAGEHGSTVEVAERICARIAARGHPVDIQRFDKAPALDGRTAVVLGSAVHDGAWLPVAAGFVRDHRAELAGMPVWMFSVGMTGALRGPARRLAERGEQQPVAELVELIAPRGYRRFSGVVRPDHFGRGGRLMFTLGGGRYGDFRDWPAIDSWADTIADALSD